MVQEASQTAGVAAEWVAHVQDVCFDWLDSPIKRLAGKDVPIPYANSLEQHVWPCSDDIVQAATEVCYR